MSESAKNSSSQATPDFSLGKSPTAARTRISEQLSDEEVRQRPLSFGLALRLFGSMGQHIWHLILAAIFCLICVAADMSVPKQISRIIDTAVTATTKGTLAELDTWALVLPVFCLYLISRVFGAAQWLLANYATNKAMQSFRQQFFQKLQALSKSFFDQHKVGWLVARNTSDLQMIREFLTFTLMIAIISGTSLTIAFYQLSRMSWYTLLPFMLVTPPMVLLSRWFRKHLSKVQRGVRDQNSRLVANLAETVRGIRVVHAYRREEFNLEAYDKINRTQRDLEIKVARLGAVFLPSFDFLGIFNIVLIIAIGTWLINPGGHGAGTQGLSPGHFAAYILYMQSILWPTRMLVELYGLAISAMASAERIFEILDIEPEIQDKTDARELTSVNGEVVFAEVSFRYTADTPWVFEKLNIRVEAGETIALVGETGAGKTTFASLVARFHDPTEGVVRLDGVDLRDLKQDSLHAQMGIVLQQGYLFSGTVLENLRFARPELPETEVINIAKSLGTHEYFASLPRGYGTRIIEGGGSLSLGQQQLLALTRAIVADPKILIMDEPTSSLDVFTERILQTALDRIVAGRTTILIAHRLSTVRDADRILVIAAGGIAEEGTHEELLKKGGRYTELVRRSEATEGLLGISAAEAENRDF